jgi:hypothetical protein
MFLIYFELYDKCKYVCLLLYIFQAFLTGNLILNLQFVFLYTYRIIILNGVIHFLLIVD